MFLNIIMSLILIGIIFSVIKNRTDQKNTGSNREEVRQERTYTPIEISDEMIVELAQLVKGGEKIKAVKKLMDETGISLVEAKDYIDKLDEAL